MDVVLTAANPGSDADGALLLLLLETKGLEAAGAAGAAVVVVVAESEVEAVAEKEKPKIGAVVLVVVATGGTPKSLVVAAEVAAIPEVAVVAGAGKEKGADNDKADVLVTAVKLSLVIWEAVLSLLNAIPKGTDGFAENPLLRGGLPGVLPPPEGDLEILGNEEFSDDPILPEAGVEAGAVNEKERAFDGLAVSVVAVEVTEGAAVVKPNENPPVLGVAVAGAANETDLLASVDDFASPATEDDVVGTPNDGKVAASVAAAKETDNFGFSSVADDKFGRETVTAGTDADTFLSSVLLETAGVAAVAVVLKEKPTLALLFEVLVLVVEDVLTGKAAFIAIFPPEASLKEAVKEEAEEETFGVVAGATTFRLLLILLSSNQLFKLSSLTCSSSKR